MEICQQTSLAIQGLSKDIVEIKKQFSSNDDTYGKY